MMRERVFLSWGLMLLLHLDPVLSVCYFPGELQGTWATQETTSRESRISRSPISYQYVTIEPDTILEWGSCHARQHNDLILTDRSGNTRCFRCVRLNVISEKLVQVWTKDLSKCYISEEAATRNCPSVDTADSSTQIMLYKVKNSWGDRDVKEIECPLNGRFSFTYRRGNEIEGVPSARCDQPTSEFSNCPYGFGFDVLYNECASFTPSRTGLQCMGSWTGVNGEEYLAVWDTAVRDGDRLPMFKCGMFREEAGTGRVFLAFSEDSTCVNSLNSPTDGYETYVLTSLPSTPLPPAVQEAKCTFPLSLLGHWHHTYVADDTIVFKDYRNFKTYSARCVHDLGDGERYIVYARTHCGEWNYNCLWLKRRSANVLEFMMGLYPKETFDDRLCDQDKFGDLTAWTTQAKSLLEEPTTCPIVGNYVGELPDASGICAQLYSDCDAPQIMYYTVSECRNGVVVSERDEYIGPTSEAGPWLPPEQKVSTGAVLTIVDEDGGGRGRRQVGGGRSRARTTTISWLWGKGRTPATPTTTTTTTPSTTISSSNGRSSIQFHDSSADRNYNWRNTNPDPFLEDPRPPIISPGDSRVPPSRQNSYSPLGFWPDSRDQPGNEERDTRVQRPYPPSFGAGRNSSDTNEDKGDGVPGRATWVPGAPPGFQSSSTQRAVATDSSHNFPHESVSQFPGSPVSPSSSHNVDNNRRLPAGDKHQILRQEREYQCLGEWEEEGRVYALTFRRDIKTYECFVGVIKPGGVVFIKEAGTVCSRGVQPEVLGMKLHRKEACSEPYISTSSSSSQASQTAQQENDRPRTTRPPWFHTTRPWKPITDGQPVIYCKVGNLCRGHISSEQESPDSFLKLIRKLASKQKHYHKDTNTRKSVLSKQLSSSVKKKAKKTWKHKKAYLHLWHPKQLMLHDVSKVFGYLPLKAIRKRREADVMLNIYATKKKELEGSIQTYDSITTDLPANDNYSEAGVTYDGNSNIISVSGDDMKSVPVPHYVPNEYSGGDNFHDPSNSATTEPSQTSGVAYMDRGDNSKVTVSNSYLEVDHGKSGEKDNVYQKELQDEIISEKKSITVASSKSSRAHVTIHAWVELHNATQIPSHRRLYRETTKHHVEHMTDFKEDHDINGEMQMDVGMKSSEDHRDIRNGTKAKFMKLLNKQGNASNGIRSEQISNHDPNGQHREELMNDDKESNYDIIMHNEHMSDHDEHGHNDEMHKEHMSDHSEHDHNDGMLKEHMKDHDDGIGPTDGMNKEHMNDHDHEDEHSGGMHKEHMSDHEHDDQNNGMHKEHINDHDDEDDHTDGIHKEHFNDHDHEDEHNDGMHKEHMHDHDENEHNNAQYKEHVSDHGEDEHNDEMHREHINDHDDEHNDRMHKEHINDHDEDEHNDEMHRDHMNDHDDDEHNDGMHKDHINDHDDEHNDGMHKKHMSDHDKDKHDDGMHKEHMSDHNEDKHSDGVHKEHMSDHDEEEHSDAIHKEYMSDHDEDEHNNGMHKEHMSHHDEDEHDDGTHKEHMNDHDDDEHNDGMHTEHMSDHDEDEHNDRMHKEHINDHDEDEHSDGIHKEHMSDHDEDEHNNGMHNEHMSHHDEDEHSDGMHKEHMNDHDEDEHNDGMHKQHMADHDEGEHNDGMLKEHINDHDEDEHSDGIHKEHMSDHDDEHNDGMHTEHMSHHDEDENDDGTHKEHMNDHDDDEHNDGMHTERMNDHEDKHDDGMHSEHMNDHNYDAHNDGVHKEHVHDDDDEHNDGMHKEHISNHDEHDEASNGMLKDDMSDHGERDDHNDGIYTEGIEHKSDLNELDQMPVTISQMAMNSPRKAARIHQSKEDENDSQYADHSMAEHIHDRMNDATLELNHSEKEIIALGTPTEDDIPSVCDNMTYIDNVTLERNVTVLSYLANCTDKWTLQNESQMETPRPVSTKDESDIPRIPISVIEYPTPVHTTAKPSMVTLPPMIWQPLAQPGRPRGRGSGSAGYQSLSQLLISMSLLITLMAIKTTAV